MKRKMKKAGGATMAALLAMAVLAGCGGQANAPAQAKGANQGKKDVVTALLPPVSASYQKLLAGYVKEFNQENPDVELKVTTASWEDFTQKLDVQVNAGSPPDIAFIGSTSVPKYLDTGMLVDLSKYAQASWLKDYDPAILNYFKNGEGTYGLPAYAEIHALGGNRQMLEKAGIDWKKVQKEGWTYDQFRQAIKNGVVKEGNQVKTYGFVFACAGVAAADYFSIFVNNAGMPAPFDKNLKYAYTSPKMLEFLKDIRSFIDDGSMPKELSSIDAGKRWNMFLTGQTMITGKGLSSFEKSAADNNAKLLAKDGSAVENSIPVDYIVLPVPTFEGSKQQAYCAVDGYVCFRGKEEPEQAHLKNVAKAAYFLDSKDRAAKTCQELYLTPVCQSGRTAYDALPPIKNKNQDNTAALKVLLSQVAEARPDITPQLGAKAIQLQNEVIIPKFQGLLAGEVSPEDMYQAIRSGAITAFGKDGCVLN